MPTTTMIHFDTSATVETEVASGDRIRLTIDAGEDCITAWLALDVAIELLRALEQATAPF